MCLLLAGFGIQWTSYPPFFGYVWMINFNEILLLVKELFQCSWNACALAPLVFLHYLLIYLWLLNSQPSSNLLKKLASVLNCMTSFGYARRFYRNG